MPVCEIQEIQRFQVPVPASPEVGMDIEKVSV